jgi:putative FmdB family regulatory protein
MPIYEFECRACHKRFSALLLSRERVSEVRCKGCGGAELERLWSRFASPRSEESRMDSLADPGNLGGLDENDPQSVARLMKKMGREMGEDLGGDFEQAVDQEMSEGLGAGPDGGGEDDSGAPGGGGTSDDL